MNLMIAGYGLVVILIMVWSIELLRSYHEFKSTAEVLSRSSHHHHYIKKAG